MLYILYLLYIFLDKLILKSLVFFLTIFTIILNSKNNEHNSLAYEVMSNVFRTYP